jgi:nucleoid-associated protein YgaU
MDNGFYTVQPQDQVEGLVGIARRFYGDAAHWPRIYEANRAIIGYNPSVLRPGQQLLLPGLISELHDGAHVQLYQIEAHDLSAGLRGIAARLWGQPERWEELYALNRGVIGDDPAALQPGQWLLLP